ncbi:MAG TPA: ATPase, T2SS/T4P/T4SS family, partial [Candidatus Gracilibacteria bacterium]|nr:ATPase, T2SS/T4P/T4SS family [Candidatus Gracilibacteria bacterium]
MSEDSRAKKQLSIINQSLKEKEIQEKAQKIGFSYIDLHDFKVNPDVLKIISLSESEQADLVVFFQIGKKIRIAINDPENLHTQQLIEKLKKNEYAVNINLASIESIHTVQAIYRSDLFQAKTESKIEFNEEKTEKITQELSEFQEKKSVPKEKISDFLSELHLLALKTRASDIHFQPIEEGVKVRYRIDGVLQDIQTLKLKDYQQLNQQIKLNAHLKLNISNEAQDGEYSFEVNERKVDVRVASLPTIYGESLTLRLLDPKKGIVSLTDLGFRKHQIIPIAKLLSKKEGMILISGPTGSGKTTSLYAMLGVL